MVQTSSSGVHGIFYNSIKSLYDNVRCAVRVHNHLTNWFDVGN